MIEPAKHRIKIRNIRSRGQFCNPVENQTHPSTIQADKILRQQNTAQHVENSSSHNFPNLNFFPFIPPDKINHLLRLPFSNQHLRLQPFPREKLSLAQ
ncbi:hypothetical protein LINGRAHAP2_LOCUS3292 [Linum grandiflorum]